MVIDKNRAACYIRVSTQEQARHGLSLGDQRAALEKYVQEHGYVVVGWYEDAGISARKPYKKRPALMQLLEDCKQNKVDTILFVKLDRYFRNVQSYYEVQPILEKHHVTWQAILEDYETVTASGRFKVNIMLSVAQDEADRDSERIKFVFEGKKQRLEGLTPTPPTGYKLENKKYVIDPETAPAVRAMLQSFLTYGSVKLAHEALQEHGVSLTYGTVVKLLYNPAYKGTYHGIDGMTPAYITPEEWDKIQSMRQKVPRRSPNRDYVFSGLCYCAECGTRMSAKFTRGVYYYACRVHTVDRKCSNAVCLNQDDIESYLLATFEEEIHKHTIRYQNRKRSVKRAPEKEINALKRRLSRLKDLYLDGAIELGEYKADKEKMEAQLASIETAPEPKYTDLSKMLMPDWKAAYAELDNAGKRAVWVSAIKEIRIFPDRHVEYTLID